MLPDYNHWVTADNTGTFFAGATTEGNIRRGLAVGISLNNANSWPRYPSPDWAPPVAFASYHSQANMIENLVVGFPHLDGVSSGAFKTDDYYLIGVDKGLVRNPGNVLIKSSPGIRFLPPAMRPDAGANDHWTLSGALWDPYGYWGPKGNYWVYDLPFLTEGARCVAVAPAGRNGMSCAGARPRACSGTCGTSRPARAASTC